MNITKKDYTRTTSWDGTSESITLEFSERLQDNPMPFEVVTILETPHTLWFWFKYIFTFRLFRFGIPQDISGKWICVNFNPCENQLNLKRFHPITRIQHSGINVVWDINKQEPV